MERSNVVAALAVTATLVFSLIRPLGADDTRGTRTKAGPVPPLKTQSRPQLDCTWSEALAELLQKVEDLSKRIDSISNRMDRVEDVTGSIEFVRKLMDEMRYEPIIEETFIWGKEADR